MNLNEYYLEPLRKHLKKKKFKRTAPYAKHSYEFFHIYFDEFHFQISVSFKKTIVVVSLTNDYGLDSLRSIVKINENLVANSDKSILKLIKRNMDLRIENCERDIESLKRYYTKQIAGFKKAILSLEKFKTEQAKIF